MRCIFSLLLVSCAKQPKPAHSGDINRNVSVQENREIKLLVASNVVYNLRDELADLESKLELLVRQKGTNITSSVLNEAELQYRRTYPMEQQTRDLESQKDMLLRKLKGVQAKIWVVDGGLMKWADSAIGTNSFQTNFRSSRSSKP